LKFFNVHYIAANFNVMMNPTPTRNNLALCRGEFDTLTEALEYAANGITGYNFYDGIGKMKTVLP